jgi:ribosomal protein S19
MIETDFFILNGEQYQEFYTEAQQVGVSIDYYLMEFTTTEGPMCECIDGEWVEVNES